MNIAVRTSFRYDNQTDFQLKSVRLAYQIQQLFGDKAVLTTENVLKELAEGNIQQKILIVPYPARWDETRYSWWRIIMYSLMQARKARNHYIFLYSNLYRFEKRVEYNIDCRIEDYKIKELFTLIKG
jgi:hypothetical protein